jgi:hypothetical protein
MTKDDRHVVKLTEDDLLAAELSALEAEANRQPNLPAYVKGENCDICGRGVPTWEFVVIGGMTGTARCGCCTDPDDPDPGNYQVGRSGGGEVICRGCGTQFWVCTPQLQECSNCWPEIWRAMDDPAMTVMQFIAKLDARDAQRRFWHE